MHEFHTDKPLYFDYQYRTSKEYIIPFLEQNNALGNNLKVLEIGCAEAGVLKAFTERGDICTGIELLSSRITLAKKFMADEVAEGKINFIVKDIYDIDIENDIGYKFDLIILKDVIEHIPEQEKFFKKLHDFLAANGKVFFGFPPWQMPFGGHQQVAKSKYLMYLPYFHLLPYVAYKGVLKMFGESEATIEGLVEIKDTGISIERFERIVKSEQYSIVKKQFFLFNPIYKYKFGVKPRLQLSFISQIPFVRNFFTTCAYYVIEK